MDSYSIDDVTRGFQWLGHNDWTELVAIHPDYKPGAQHFKWNKEHNAFPRLRYARRLEQVIAFIDEHPDRLVCHGLNPRPKEFFNKRGYPRSALESEIEKSQSVLFDFDTYSRTMTKAQGQAIRRFFENKLDVYCQDEGLMPPVKAFSGGGVHALFAYPAVLVSEYPDIKLGQNLFAASFREEFGAELEDLELKLDEPGGLQRLVKIYGTAKPIEGALCSRFYGENRVEDGALLEHLLALDIPKHVAIAGEGEHGLILRVDEHLPSDFSQLLAEDEVLRDLWLGRSKPHGSDNSRSAYDYAIACRAIELGYDNPHELATALTHRPEGGVINSGKGESYLRHTIGNAFKNTLTRKVGMTNHVRR